MGAEAQFVTETVAGTHQFGIRLVLQFERVDRDLTFAFFTGGGTADGSSQGIGQIGFVGKVRSRNTGQRLGVVERTSVNGLRIQLFAKLTAEFVERRYGEQRKEACRFSRIAAHIIPRSLG